VVHAFKNVFQISLDILEASVFRHRNQDRSTNFLWLTNINNKHSTFVVNSGRYRCYREVAKNTNCVVALRGRAFRESGFRGRYTVERSGPKAGQSANIHLKPFFWVKIVRWEVGTAGSEVGTDHRLEQLHLFSRSREEEMKDVWEQMKENGYRRRIAETHI